MICENCGYEMISFPLRKEIPDKVVLQCMCSINIADGYDVTPIDKTEIKLPEDFHPSISKHFV
jgi:hypothetical protein